jgi:hypothetical protein
VLAEKLLPGLTNVASQPRYFSLLCGGAQLAGELSHPAPREERRLRLDCVLRLERFWAIANVLATERTEALSTMGLRGVTRATKVVDALAERGAKKADAHFDILGRQQRYGAVGIYGAVADGLRLWDRKTLGLTPDLGDRLGSAFLRDTVLPLSIRQAVLRDTPVAMQTLADWGERAHLAAEVGEVEAACLADAVHREPVRSRMLQTLAEYPALGGETELARLARIAGALELDAERRDLREPIVAIGHYEASYSRALLGFERILYRCRSSPSGTVTPAELGMDEVIRSVRTELPEHVAAFGAALDEAGAGWFRRDLGRLDDVRTFLEGAAASAKPADLAEALLSRHGEIQRGKLDHGRPKLPWVQRTGDAVALTLARAGGISTEPIEPAQVIPHPYRVAAADGFLRATGGAS